MITFGKPYIKIAGEKARLNCSITVDDETKNLWCEVASDYSEYLCDERGDAYLIAALHYAMMNGHDITLDVPVTESLLFGIETYLIPALIENNPNYYPVRIYTETTNDYLPNAGAVGTGISCGVDSLHSLAEHTNSKFKGLNITHLTFNNVGSHGEGDKARELYQSRLRRPKEFAEEYGFKFVACDSNLMDVIKQSHFKTHTYSSMFPIFCLQKLYSTYYYASSGYRFNEFNLKDKPQSSCGSYEILSLQVFSTPQLKIYSEGMGLTRLGKLKQVINYEPSYRYLNVCLSEGDNCGHCEKCVRTLLGIDALGALDKYRAVFDIDNYIKNRKWYLQQLVYRVKDKKHDYFEMYPYFKDQISWLMKTKGMGYVLFSGIKDTIRKNDRLFRLAKNISDKK